MSSTSTETATSPETSTSTEVCALTRRRFLAWSGVTAGAALAAAGCTATPADLVERSMVDPLDPAHGVLVVITLYGGNDGLNTVVPASDPAYQKARPELAYRPDEVLDLGDGLGLNPGLTGMKSLWDNGSLAIIRGAGYPGPDRSHFRSMAIWQTAAPKEPVPTGWLGRWLDLAGDPLLGLSLNPVLPPMLAGMRTAGAALAPTLGTANKGLLTLVERLGSGDHPTPYETAVATSYRDLLEANESLAPHLAKGGQGKDRGGALARQLDQIAAFVEAGVPTRVYAASLGGFDTHADERGTQQRLLTELDQALSGFQQRLDRTDRGRQVVTMVHSEFGRRVAANASDGTDHGTAGPVFVLGRGVNGGGYGDQPGLTDLDDGDLRPTTDFRDVYASLLSRVLGADPARLLHGWTGQVDGLLG